MTLNAGQLDQRITLQVKTLSRNDLGQPVPTWANLATTPTVWARARPVRGAENFAAGQLQATADVVFTIRYRSDVTEAMRVLWRGEPHEITAPPVDVNGARVALELYCTKGIRDGR